MLKILFETRSTLRARVRTLFSVRVSSSYGKRLDETIKPDTGSQFYLHPGLRTRFQINIRWEGRIKFVIRKMSEQFGDSGNSTPANMSFNFTLQLSGNEAVDSMYLPPSRLIIPYCEC
ncbi:uncharacterized protein PHALS_01638 [Plasmopara halstedii]|uniref:Uncharacterized protein n=1 Tax=Plasmopara halstedii TaxID=4781 RepID=A0A0P1AW02_PLAHL|nr:uncharacterized protein PHALS_01638 [Plasmopara halstedii]CEG45334.1 hypothetical protein PHALS_01638 [Plasmopara halstedii]|eukprot:XP_024581703.1 hypothetical protein PHALS_01638 [Plasmopara halstedii]